MSVEQDTIETFLEEEDIGVVESRIMFAKEDYTMLTAKIEYYAQERSRLEASLRKLNAVRARLKNWQVDEDC
tara:strand:+ start:325 stop:540 length:216 start_codon:yes stop_codon:yes gene_type:complete